jgi:hypothetical protein
MESVNSKGKAYPFDPEVLVEENFPLIEKPSKDDINLGDCDINLRDFDQKIPFSNIKQQFDKFFDYEIH